MTLRRLLFASCHGYVDPSSGAACATRDVLEMLAACGVECRVLSTAVLDYDRDTAVGPLVAALGGPAEPSPVALARGGSVAAYDFELGGVRVTLLATASSLLSRSPDQTEGRAFLDLAGQALARFRPQVVLTYGGHPVNLALMARARRAAVPVVFHLHNLAYRDRRPFGAARAILVPSEFSRRHFSRLLGLECVALPLPVVPARVIAPAHEPRYLTFVNPQPAKGAGVFARIASELQLRRPEIPLLVVEGRGTAEGLAGVGLDLSELRNLHRIPNVSSPRVIYRTTRALLMPSLVPESFGRVAVEALANGIPVLASDRGALPATLGDAGFVFTLPASCSPASPVVPTPREIAPWLATIERLWDDPVWEASHRARAIEAAGRFTLDVLAERYLGFFNSLASEA